jgi:hypothetical protein
MGKTCGKSRGAGRRPPKDLHRLAAVTGDLELTEARDPELGAAFPAHEDHLEVLDVLHLRRCARPAARCGSERGEAYPRDHDADEDRAQDQPDAHATESTHALVGATYRARKFRGRAASINRPPEEDG